MNFIYRKATLEDIPKLEKLIKKSAEAINKTYYSKQQIEAALKTAWRIDPQLIVDATYWVVENKKQVLIGCGGWSKRKRLFGQTEKIKINDTASILGVDAAKIRAFFVHPDYVRLGIGKQLLEICEAEARENGFTSLELIATLSGEKLYNSKGYIGEKPYEIRLTEGMTNKVVAMHKILS